MIFEKALTHLRAGKKIHRLGWRNQGAYWQFKGNQVFECYGDNKQVAELQDCTELLYNDWAIFKTAA